MSGQDYRAEFDATVTFSNGGALNVEGFRVDVPGPDCDTEEVGTLFVASLGLLMTERVDVRRLRVFPEPHKGTRGGPSDAGHEPNRDAAWRWVELSHVVSGVEESPDGRAPATQLAAGIDLVGLPLSGLVDLPAVVVRTAGSGSRAVDVGAVAPLDVTGRVVLLHTGGDEHWGTPEYARDAPFLTEAGARRLVEQGARLVGIDAVGIDDVSADVRPARTLLLAAGIPVVEHLTGLEQVPPTGARFTAAPARLADVGTAPVRAFAAVASDGGAT